MGTPAMGRADMGAHSMSSVSGVAKITVTQGGVVTNLGASTDLIPAVVETKDFDGGDPLVQKFIEAIYLSLSSQDERTGMTLEVLVRDQAYEDLVVGDSAVVTSGPVQLRPRGAHYVRLRITDTGVLARWKLSRITVYGQARGRRH